MAEYKVAQDVEAEDKLLGPFSFRQFIYLIIVAMAGFIAFALFRLFPPLVIIPLPIIVFFGALALPLRKDQPMETYLAALVSFYTKPRKRLWKPDGVQSLVTITAPRVEQKQYTKDFSSTEAERRLGYLANIADSRGWSVRNAQMPSDASPMKADIYNDAARTEDPLDATANVAQNFNAMIEQSNQRRREEMLSRMVSPQPASTSPTQQSPSAPVTPSPQQSAAEQPTPTPETTSGSLRFDPYPLSMRQSVIAPLSDQPTPQSQPSPAPATSPEPSAQKTTSDTSLSPDIMDLANSNDLSIATIAHEAERRTKKHQADDGEVVISLR